MVVYALILALGKTWQKGPEFEDSQGYTAWPYLKKKKLETVAVPRSLL